MIKKEIKLKIVTPLLIGGLIRKQGQNTVIDANLNVNSIKGTIRWWFRVIKGWQQNVLFDEEKELFGSTKNASSFKIKLYYPYLNSSGWDDNQFTAKNRFGNYEITYFNRRTKQKETREIPFNGLRYLSFFNKFPESRYVYTIHSYYKTGQR